MRAVVRTGEPARDAPRRSRVSVVAPWAVGVVIAGLLGWSAWPTLRPAREVRVVQAVFDLSAGGAEDAQAPGRGDGEGAAGRTGGVPDGPTVQAAGWLEPEPYYTAVSALADGIIERIEVLEGEGVEAGAVVARLVSRDSELRLARAEAALLAAEAELAAAQTEWDEPTARVRAVEVTEAELADARAARAQLPLLVRAERAVLEQLEEELARAEASLAQGASTDLQVLILRRRTEAQRAGVEALEARGPMLEARERAARAEAEAARRDGELRVAEARRLASARASVAAARAAREEAALELERMVIRAPITGVVKRRLKSPGDKAVRMMDDPHSAHIVHLYDPARLQARVDVPLADASHVYVGQRCEVVVEILPDTTFAGEVSRITNEADLQKNTLQIKVRVLDPSPLLKPEMLTRVKFVGDDGGGAGGAGAARGLEDVLDAGRHMVGPGVGRHSGARPGVGGPGAGGLSVGVTAQRVVVPAGALIEGGSGARVWAVRDRRSGRGVVRAVAVEVVSREPGWVAVRGALGPGELLAIDAAGLRDGEPVRFRSADASGMEATP